MLQYLEHHQHPNVYATVETKIPAPLMGVAWNSFIYKAEVHVDNDHKIYYVQLKVISNSDITTTQTPLEIGIMNMILSFQNIYGNWKILENHSS